MTFRSCPQTVPRYLRIAFRTETTIYIYILARVQGVCHILVLSVRSALGNTKQKTPNSFLYVCDYIILKNNSS
jgi:hypothetical protein